MESQTTPSPTSESASLWSRINPVLWQMPLLLLAAGAIFFTNLGQARLWDRDEPRNAGCAAEMMARGDWVVPMFNDELRHQKPVMLYWLMMSAYSVFGQNEFAARFWSAVLALGTVALTYDLARRLFDRHVAWLAGVALSTSLMFVVAARAATPDSVLIFFSTLAFWFYVVGTFERDSNGQLVTRTSGAWFPQQLTYVVGMYAAMGLGVLAKGPVALVVPTAIVGMFLLIQRLPALDAEFWRQQGWIARTVIQCLRPFAPLHFLKTCWSMRPVLAVSIVAVIAAPWYIWVGLRTEGDFLAKFLFTENLGRATNVFENHSGGWWYYPVAILIGFFPWAVFAGPVALTTDRLLSRDSDKSVPVRFLLCWIGVQVILFSLASTKLPSYVTPCYPGLAILTAACVRLWVQRSNLLDWRWFNVAMPGMVVAGTIVLAGLAYLGVEFLDGNWTIALIGLVPLAGGGVASWYAWKRRPEFAVMSVAGTSVAFALLFFGFGTGWVDSTRQTQFVLDPVKHATDDRGVATYRCLESSWVVYGGKPIHELSVLDQPTGASLNRDRFWHVKPRLTPEEFVSERPDALLITTNEHLDELQKRLPGEWSVVESSPFFLKKDRELVLLERSNVERAAATSPTPDAKNAGWR